MAACPSCGKDNAPDARFCSACGSPLVAGGASREVRKTVTVLFCDVTGSTALGERLDPEATRKLMSRYFETARTILERHGASVEKFIGDAVMAVFGIPQVHEDDALRATRAALELRDSVTELELRIGVNTGEVVAGTGETLVTGDAVNVAARLEQAAAPGDVLLGEQTYRLVRDAVEAEPVEPSRRRARATPSAPTGSSRVVEGAAPFARRLDSPLVGREGGTDAARAGVRARRRASARATCSRSSARPASGSHGSPHEFVESARRTGDGRARALPLLRRGNHVLAARRDPARPRRAGRTSSSSLERRAGRAEDRERRLRRRRPRRGLASSGGDEPGGAAALRGARPRTRRSSSSSTTSTGRNRRFSTSSTTSRT